MRAVIDDSTESAYPYYAEASFSGIRWPAIFAGAFTAMAVSLVLLLLGSALELSSLSPLSDGNNSPTKLTLKVVVWLIVMQWIASGLGGYITGRLRTRWIGAHTDEAFFRDTAHGFLSWAVATVATAALFASVGTSAVKGGAQATATVASGAAMGAAQNPENRFMRDPNGYFIDILFRTGAPAPDASENTTASANPDVPVRNNTPAWAARGEIARIFFNAAKNGGMPDADKSYLAVQVAARTGLTPEQATQRVNEVVAQMDAERQKMRENAETARKAGMKASLYLFLSMLVGAFIASVAGAMGGQHRDRYPFGINE